jgi:hypothetical protein
LKLNQQRLNELSAKVQPPKLPPAKKTSPQTTTTIRQPNPNLIKIKVKTFSGPEKEITIKKSTTGEELRQYIYAYISDSLQP